jgi:hypothetical protein
MKPISRKNSARHLRTELGERASDEGTAIDIVLLAPSKNLRNWVYAALLERDDSRVGCGHAKVGTRKCTTLGKHGLIVLMR